MTDKEQQRSAVLVTGAATRLGLAFSTAMADRGYDIALHYNHSSEQALQQAELIRHRGVRCETFQFDLSENDPGRLIEQVHHRFPDLQVLINSASTYHSGTIADTAMRLLQQQFAVNFFAPYLMSASFSRLVARGNIINILDNKIAFQQYQYGAYLMSKKALAEFTTLAAMEFSPRIRVNGIAPGVVLPGETRTRDYIDWRIQGIPLQRQGQVEDLIQALNYLLDNEFVTGQILFVDGGEGINHQGLNAEDYQFGDESGDKIE